MGTIVIAAIPATGVAEQQVQQRDPRPIQLNDPRFEETYTASVKRTSTGWSGRIPDVPEVKMCQGITQQALLEALADSLYEILKARSAAWDRQIEEDIKAGRLDPLRDEILEDIQANLSWKDHPPPFQSIP